MKKGLLFSLMLVGMMLVANIQLVVAQSDDPSDLVLCDEKTMTIGSSSIDLIKSRDSYVYTHYLNKYSNWEAIISSTSSQSYFNPDNCVECINNNDCTDDENCVNNQCGNDAQEEPDTIDLSPNSCSDVFGFDCGVYEANELSNDHVVIDNTLDDCSSGSDIGGGDIVAINQFYVDEVTVNQTEAYIGTSVDVECKVRKKYGHKAVRISHLYNGINVSSFETYTDMPVYTTEVYKTISAEFELQELGEHVFRCSIYSSSYDTDPICPEDEFFVTDNDDVNITVIARP